jgi:hypothetical protein
MLICELENPFPLVTRTSNVEERTVATYQTLLESGRLYKFSPQSFKAIVVDEAHHAAAPSYVQRISPLVVILLTPLSGIAAYSPSFTRKSNVQSTTPTVVPFRTLFQFLGFRQHSAGTTGSPLARYSKG